MDKNIEWYVKKKIDRTLESLKNNNIKGYYIENREQLFEKLKKLITENSIIGVGDSVTLSESGVIDFFREGNYEFLDKYREGITSEEKKADLYSKFFC